MSRSRCKNCKHEIVYNFTIQNEWVHTYGGTYCLDQNGFTATPLSRAQPILEIETL